jgi:hypothetical protein
VVVVVAESSQLESEPRLKLSVDLEGKPTVRVLSYVTLFKVLLLLR